MSPLPSPLRMRRAFVDSSAYLALLDRTDPYHAAAVSIARFLAGQRYRQYTTNVLLMECHALVLSRLGIAIAFRFLTAMREGNTVVVRVRARDEERAQQILARYTDKDFSFVDAISFAVMERLGIRHAFTFDQHFAQYGFTVLNPAQV